MQRIKSRKQKLILFKKKRRRRLKQENSTQNRHNTLPPLNRVRPKKYSIFHKYKNDLTSTSIKPNPKSILLSENILKIKQIKFPKQKSKSLSKRQKNSAQTNKETRKSLKSNLENLSERIGFFLKKKKRKPPKPKGMFSDQFSVKHMLGKGSNSEVYFCRERRTNVSFAVKMISKRRLKRPNQIKNFKVDLITRTKS